MTYFFEVWIVWKKWRCQRQVVTLVPRLNDMELDSLCKKNIKHTYESMIRTMPMINSASERHATQKTTFGVRKIRCDLYEFRAWVFRLATKIKHFLLRKTGECLYIEHRPVKMPHQHFVYPQCHAKRCDRLNTRCEVFTRKAISISILCASPYR